MSRRRTNDDEVERQLRGARLTPDPVLRLTNAEMADRRIRQHGARGLVEPVPAAGLLRVAEVDREVHEFSDYTGERVLLPVLLPWSNNRSGVTAE